MAVIQFTGLVNQIRGKVNGSVLNKSRTVNTVQKKQQPPKGSRGFQSEIRQDFSYAQRRWKDLTPTQQNSWQVAASFNPSRDRFGNQVILSGYNQYIKAFVLARYADSFVGNNAYPGAAPSQVFELYSILPPIFYISASGGTGFSVYINDYDAPQVEGYGFIFDISLPVSSGVTSYHGRWVNVTGSGTVGGIVVSIDQDLGVYYPMPVQGQRVLWRARLVHIQTGAVVVEQRGVFTDWADHPTFESLTKIPATPLNPIRVQMYFYNKSFIDNVNFRLEARYHFTAASCPVYPLVQPVNVVITEGLLAEQIVLLQTNLPVGNCAALDVRIIRVSDSVVVDHVFRTFSNL